MLNRPTNKFSHAQKHCRNSLLHDISGTSCDPLSSPSVTIEMRGVTAVQILRMAPIHALRQLSGIPHHGHTHLHAQAARTVFGDKRTKGLDLEHHSSWSLLQASWRVLEHLNTRFFVEGPGAPQHTLLRAKLLMSKLIDDGSTENVPRHFPRAHVQRNSQRLSLRP